MCCVIIDGYVDEPAVLGVPPYVSTYVRYVAGAFFLKGYDVRYYTIDQVRADNLWHAFSDYDVVVVIGGLTVPGNYIGGVPITPIEVQRIFAACTESYRIIVGAIGKAFSNKGGTFARESSPVELEFDEYIENISEWFDKESYTESVRKLSIAGAEIVKQHPRYPNIICEIEVSLGCERRTFCTFCTEPILHPKFFSRPVRDVVDEIETLYRAGVSAFRLGRSANILAYGSDFNNYKINPIAIEELYSEVRKRCPRLKVLHTDNANPAYIANNLEQSMRSIETIVRYNTPGDIFSFGVESFDPSVRKKNNIDGTVEDIDFAVKIVNEIGRVRDADGVPKLLPGINLIFGLFGETKRTFELNYKKLLQYLENDFLIRRINLRQIMVFPGTPLYYLAQRKSIKTDKRLFEHYKYLIRNNVDNPMLKKVFPSGTIVRNVIPEKREGKVTFGRPLGTYPILIGIPTAFDDPTDVVIVSHGQRSLTGVRLTELSNLTLEELSSVPGIGNKSAIRIKNGDYSTISSETMDFLRKYFSNVKK
ncbi:MAG: radical SAM protein [Fervidobacterium sp.]|nr:radical SAM protein [Fervidobacterium sp.]